MMIQNEIKSPYAAVRPMHPLQNRWTGGLWKERFDTCKNVTIPHIRVLFEDENVFHVVENFRIAAGQKEGRFKGTPFGAVSYTHLSCHIGPGALAVAFSRNID